MTYNIVRLRVRILWTRTLTLVPEVSLVRSSVVPDGTARADKTMVAQEALDLLTAAAPLDPENVQDALLARSGAAVGAGAAAGRAAAIADVAKRLRMVET